MYQCTDTRYAGIARTCIGAVLDQYRYGTGDCVSWKYAHVSLLIYFLLDNAQTIYATFGYRLDLNFVGMNFFFSK